MRICVVGNSHVAALKEGYELIKEQVNIELDFYSIPGGGGPTLNVADGIIINNKSSIKTTVELGKQGLLLEKYDAILLSGVGIHAIRCLNNHVLQKSLVNEFLCNEQSNGFSKALLVDMLKEYFYKMPSVANIEKICNNFDGKVFIQMFPLPTKVIFGQEDFDLPYDINSTKKLLSWYYTIQNDLLHGVAALYSNTEVINYPVEWLISGLSPAKYSTNDAWHMNSQFGRFYIERIIDLIK